MQSARQLYQKKLQAALYYARKRRLKRLKAQQDAEPPPEPGGPGTLDFSDPANSGLIALLFGDN